MLPDLKRHALFPLFVCFACVGDSGTAVRKRDPSSASPEPRGTESRSQSPVATRVSTVSHQPVSSGFAVVAESTNHLPSNWISFCRGGDPESFGVGLQCPRTIRQSDRFLSKRVGDRAGNWQPLGGSGCPDQFGHCLHSVGGLHPSHSVLSARFGDRAANWRSRGRRHHPDEFGHCLPKPQAVRQSH